MRTLPTAMRALLNAGGPFIGDNRASSRCTVEPAWALHTTSGNVGGRAAKKLPIRYWQTAANDQTEVEIPHIQSVQIARDLTQQAATLTVTIYNTQLGANGTAVGLATKLGQPGYFSWNYGNTPTAQARWGQVPNSWENLLAENACIRVYQGYGGQALSIPDAVTAGNLILTGVFLLDSPAIEASTGLITLNGRDMAKLLIDQYTVPPLIPTKMYPLNYWGPDQAINPKTEDISPAMAADLATYGANGWAQSRCTFDTSSQGSAGNPGHALDNNPNTYWLSETCDTIGGHSVAEAASFGGNEFPFIQFDCTDEITGFYIDPYYGDYRVYVSVMVAGDWVDIGLPGTIDGIKYVSVVHVDYETAQWYTFDRRYKSQKVRLTFASLFPTNTVGWGLDIESTYACGMRNFTIGQRQDLNASTKQVTGFATTPNNLGYHLCTAAGLVFRYGSAINRGQLSSANQAPVTGWGHRPHWGGLASPVIGIAAPAQGGAYWLCQQNGVVTPFGYNDTVINGILQPLGTFGSLNPNSGADVVAFRCRADEKGYWMVTAAGKVHAFGTAGFHGDVSGTTLSPPSSVVDICPTIDQNGYWILTSSGHVYPFGSASGSTGASGVIVGMEAAEGGGYWLCSDAGIVNAFGGAPNYGSISGGLVLNAPMWAIRRSSTNAGYYMVAEDGGVFTFGDAAFYGSLQGLQAMIPDYTDYAHIILDLALWAGFYLKPTDALPSYAVPTAFGIIENTGAWDTLGPLGIDFFDKRPVIDVMTDIANLVGFIVRVDEVGSLRFEAPNIWADGNFDENNNIMLVDEVPYIPVIDERITLSDFVMTQSDVNLRSPIVVAVTDPYLYGGPVKGTNVTTFTPPYAAILKGIVKSAEFTVPLQVDAKDQQFFAELIALRIWQSARVGAVTAWCDPSICLNDQVRIMEASTGETNIHYVNAIQTMHTLEDGKWEMQLTTNWLGDVGDGENASWAITSNLTSFFGANTVAPDTYEVGGSMGQYNLTDRLNKRLAASQSPKTATFTESDGAPGPPYVGTLNALGQIPVNLRNDPAIIVGPALVGATLTCDTGRWIGTAPVTFTFAWNNTAGSSSTDTYVLEEGDTGNLVSCTVTATNDAGSGEATAAGPGLTVDGTPGPQNVVLPVITGSPLTGSTLTCSSGAWTGSGLSYGYVWNGNGDTISLTNTYVVDPEDLGLTVTCTVTAFSGGTSGAVTSEPTAVITVALNLPVNITSPAISGTTLVGNILTIDPGTWTGLQPITFSYLWNNVAGSSTTDSYTLESGDGGNLITCTVTATNDDGSTDAITDFTIPISGSGTGSPFNTSPPILSGTFAQGDTITCSTGTWGGGAISSFGYEWNGTANADGDNTYVLTAADVGNSITCTVTATNGFGSDFSTTDSGTITPPGTLPSNTSPPTISGTTTQTYILTVDPGTWDGDPTIVFTYDWSAAGSSFTDSYLLEAGDVGNTVTCEVTGTNAFGDASATTVATATIIAGSGGSSAPSNTVLPTISGTDTQTYTLTVDPGDWDGTTPIDFTYVWNGAGTSTSGTYLLGAGDVGNTVTCTVTATNAVGSDSATSAATSTIIAGSGGGGGGGGGSTLPSVPTGPTPPGAGYRLVFGDHFVGSSLDTTMWVNPTTAPYNTSWEQASYDSGQVSVSGGNCVLTCQPGTSGGYANISGQIHTGDSSNNFLFSPNHGGPFYIEGRIKIPGDAAHSNGSVFPAFWATTYRTYGDGSNNDRWTREMDFFEFGLAPRPGQRDQMDSTQIAPNAYGDPGNPPNQENPNQELGFDPASDFHLYTVQINTDGSFTLWIDGTHIWDLAAYTAIDWMGIIVNYALSELPGSGFVSDTMLIDYIACWQDAAVTSGAGVLGGGLATGTTA